MKKMKMKTKDFTSENIEKIGNLFPGCITETKSDNGDIKKAINFDRLKQELSDDVLEGNEAYDFTWAGKKAAMVEANKSTNKTLRPCKEESAKWDKTENLYIEGDNLEVLKLLQESYLGKVKIIYIDPPYNTGNDFVYRDDYKQAREDYEEETGEVDKEGNRLIRNTNSNGRFHSVWCSMMYSRLKLAKNLLTDDGVIFISIGDEEYSSLRQLSNEVFNEHNYIGSFVVENNPKGRKNGKFISVTNEYCLIYALNIDKIYFNKTIPKHSSDMVEDSEGNYIRKSGKRVLMGENTLNNLVHNLNSSKHYVAYIKDEDIKFYKEKTIDESKENLIAQGYRRYITYREGKFVENTYTQDKFKELFYNKALDIREDKIYEKHFSDNMQTKSVLVNVEYDAIYNNEKIHYKLDLKTTSAKQDLTCLMGGEYFSYPKNVSYICHLLNLHPDKNSLVLDFFSGSATTAHAVMQLNAEDGGNRKFIMVQLPEECDEKSEAYKAGYKNICEIGKERVRKAAKQIHEDNPEAKFDDGFRVFKLDSSNMKDVFFAPNDISKDLLSGVESNIKDDRSDLDLLFACLIDWGVPISGQYDQQTIDGCKVHFYEDGLLVACFEAGVSEKCIKEIAKLKPERVVFRDSGFSDSASKINAAELFKQLSPKTSFKVL